jgi:hypothetical protein
MTMLPDEPPTLRPTIGHSSGHGERRGCHAVCVHRQHTYFDRSALAAPVLGGNVECGQFLRGILTAESRGARM